MAGFLLLRRSGEKEWKDVARGLDLLVGEEGGRELLCGSCAHTITSSGEATTVDGARVHVRTNPAGIEFTFGCFRRAPGVQVEGPPTSEHCWFSGYRWSYCLCASCSVHLGWLFAGPEPAFHGLILDRLREGPAERER